MDYEEVLCYYPPEVTRLLAIGSSSWIGILEDNQKILKYPKVIGKEWNSLILENRIYKALESNPRIVTCYGLDDRGLLLGVHARGVDTESHSEQRCVQKYRRRSKTKVVPTNGRSSFIHPPKERHPLRFEHSELTLKR